MKVLIVGAGLIGSGIAWRLARSGVDVTLLDGRPERAASLVGAGLLIPAGGRVSHHHLQLRQASADAYPRFVAELEEEAAMEVGYLTCGTLTLAYPQDGEQSLDGLFSCLKGLGVPCERLTTEECLECEPQVTPSILGGLRTPDHQVDSQKLLQALHQASAARGVERVAENGRHVTAKTVTTDSGRVLEGDKVVVASGAWLRELMPDLPVFPVKGEVIHLRGPQILNHNLRLQKRDLYLANRGDGRVVVGSTELEAGFDYRSEGVEGLRSAAIELVPALADFELSESRVGFRPKVADGLPLLGDYRGIAVAGAHYRNGILLTPITSTVMAEFLIEETVPELMKPFLASRAIKDRRNS